MNYSENCELIDLFKIFTIEEDDDRVDTKPYINYGLVFIDEYYNIVKNIPYNMAECCRRRYGIDNREWSQTFHKTVEKVLTAPQEQLIFEQLMHYFSTYGLESLGLKASPVIPVEELCIDFKQELKFNKVIIIKVVSEKTAIDYINNYMRTTVSPNKDNLISSRLVEKSTITADEIKSYELKVIYYKITNTVPTNPEEFLRYLVYKATGSTLLIKNKETIDAIKNSWSYHLITKEDFDKIAPEKLAEIFYRYKPLFLAFKSIDGCAPIINKIRRLAKKCHKPLSEISVQNVASLMAQHKYDAVAEVIKKASNRQLIKLYNYAHNEACSQDDNRIYNIRNGKLYTKSGHNHFQQTHLEHLITQELYNRYKNKFSNMKFYIPSNIDYAVPTTEKQFVKNIPYGTRIYCPMDKAFAIGIYWNNKNRERVDLDLHLTGLNESYGWNANYTNNSDIAFSGDMTDATNGAAEAYYINKHDNDAFILSVSNFTSTPNEEYKFLITEKIDLDRTHRTPPINVNDAIVFPITLKFNDKASDMTLGLIEKSAFIFYGGDMECSRIPNRELKRQAINALKEKIEHTLRLEILLRYGGATIYNDDSYEALTEEEKDTVICLTPDEVLPSTFFDIIDEKVS